MANSYATLLDMAIRNGHDRAVPLIEETSKAMPEVSGINWDGSKIPGVGVTRTMPGEKYKTLVRTNTPVVSFRNANEPPSISKSTYENRLVDTFILNPRWQCDKAVADKSVDGPDAYIADEATAMTEASMQLLGAQFYYGRGALAGGVGAGNDGKGFPGLIDVVAAQFTMSAGGTLGGGAANAPDNSPMCTSVWFVKYGPQHVQWVYGLNGTLSIPDKRIETIYLPDPKNNNVPGAVTGYVQEMLAYPGLQVGSVRSIARLSRITAETGHTLTDAMLYQLESLLLVRPDVCFMHPLALEQLRESRTTFNPSGSPAPTPTMTGSGIPIAPSRSISRSETA